MDREQLLRRYLRERFGDYREEMGLDESLEGVVDSMGLFELVDFVEEEFGLSIPNEEFSPQRFASIAEILRLIDEFSAD